MTQGHLPFLQFESSLITAAFASPGTRLYLSIMYCSLSRHVDVTLFLQSPQKSTNSGSSFFSLGKGMAFASKGHWLDPIPPSVNHGIHSKDGASGWQTNGTPRLLLFI